MVWGEEAKGWRRSVAASTRGVSTKRHGSASTFRTSTIGALRTLLVVVGIVLILGGLVWIAQGLNLPFAPRSFMTSDRTWIVLGAIAVMGGGFLVWSGRRRPEV